jgi:hypothetical protein
LGKHVSVRVQASGLIELPAQARHEGARSAAHVEQTTTPVQAKLADE